jgi:tetratricopeptide (TPR) repeat protein
VQDAERHFAAESTTLPSARSSRSNRIVALAAVGLFLLPVFYRGLRRELGRWCQAAAMEASLRDDAEQAILWSERGLAFDEQNVTLRALLANWKTADGTADDAVADADLALEISRASYLRDANPDTTSNLVDALNQSAYLRAIADQELVVAREYIDEAFELLSDVDDWRLANFLDTRGYIRYLLGELDEAEADLDLATHLVESGTELYLAGLRRQSQMTIDQRPIEQLRRGADHSRAVIYHHRGLVRAALGNTHEADADFHKARELGYNPLEGVW